MEQTLRGSNNEDGRLVVAHIQLPLLRRHVPRQQAMPLERPLRLDFIRREGSLGVVILGAVQQLLEVDYFECRVVCRNNAGIEGEHKRGSQQFRTNYVRSAHEFESVRR